MRLAGLSDPFVNEVDDVLRRSAREKNLRDTGLFQTGDIRIGDDAADEHGYVVHTFFVEQFHELWAKRVVRAGKNR